MSDWIDFDDFYQNYNVLPWEQAVDWLVVVVSSGESVVGWCEFSNPKFFEKLKGFLG